MRRNGGMIFAGEKPKKLRENSVSLHPPQISVTWD
jgi:hypothetical protein